MKVKFKSSSRQIFIGTILKVKVSKRAGTSSLTHGKEFENYIKLIDTKSSAQQEKDLEFKVIEYIIKWDGHPGRYSYLGKQLELIKGQSFGCDSIW